MTKFRTTCAALFFAVGLLVGAGAAQAGVSGPAQTTTYRFAGACTDCSGFGTATLVLLNYTNGTLANAGNFFSFDYTSNLVTFAVTTANLSSFSAVLGPNFPSAASVSLFATTNNIVFQSQTNGSWCTGSACLNDFGPSSTWIGPASPVPEPASIALLIVGIAGLGAVARRARANS